MLDPIVGQLDCRRIGHCAGRQAIPLDTVQWTVLADTNQTGIQRGNSMMVLVVTVWSPSAAVQRPADQQKHSTESTLREIQFSIDPKADGEEDGRNY